jgi:hypothetical protein
VKGEPARRLPGHRLRALAQRLCGPATVEHVVDPIVADLQHEWMEARERSHLVRCAIRLRGYAAFTRALALHAVLGASRHLAENAFGTTPEDRDFHRRAGSGTLTALVISTLLVVLHAVVTMTRSLLFMFTHLRWPGPPTAWDVLPAALQIAADPHGLLLLVPCLVAVTLPPSLLFGILLGLREARATTPAALPKSLLRGTGAVAVAAALFALVSTGWVVPEAGRRYRHFFIASAFGTRDRPVPGRPAEQPLPTLQELARAESAAGRRKASESYVVEWHRRMACATAPIAFALLGLGLAAGRREWTTRQIGAVTAMATFAYDSGLRWAGRALAIDWPDPLALVWSADFAVVLLAAALVFRGYRAGALSLTAR